MLNRLPPRALSTVLLSVLIVLAGWVLLTGESTRARLKASGQIANLHPTGYPQLVSIKPLPGAPADGEICQWASGEARLVSLTEPESAPARAGSASVTDVRRSVTLERPPLRVIRDEFPTYSAVAVDPRDNEIVLQDENLFQIMVYDRMANTPPTAKMTEPKRVIGGKKTKMEFNCGLYVDPNSGDIYSINNDTLDTMVVFSRNARGNVPPDRQLHTPHGTYGIAVDEARQELFLTVEHVDEVLAYRKMAQGDEKPLRIIQGPHTRLADPHGIGIDSKRNLIFVANHGNAKQPGVPGSGRFVLPSINVYRLDARGDAVPIRVLQGANTQLNWPGHVYVDQEHGEVYVANDAGNSILVFKENDDGNAAPTRVLKGPKTQIKNPTGVFVDTKNDELVVANMGNHRATVYRRTADGNTPPLRVIRSAPANLPALQIGNPGAVAYDTKRNEIIVPN